MLINAIKSFPRQFLFSPRLVNGAKLKKHDKFIIAGMGGSSLAGDIIKTWKPEMDIVIHRDYGLPSLVDIKQRLIIACSYSGNTEETISAFRKARFRNLPIAVITTGGRLAALAHQSSKPTVLVPNTGIQPRTATGFMLMALLLVMGEKRALKEARNMAKVLKPNFFQNIGKKLANKLINKVPIIYSSARNAAVANNWKIKFGENAKIPVFMNLFPELNHNEMNGFGVKQNLKKTGTRFHFIFLRDDEDHPGIAKRMKVTKKLYQRIGLPVEEIKFKGKTRLERIFNSLQLADWTSMALALMYGLDPEPVPMVEEFKKLIS